MAPEVGLEPKEGVFSKVASLPLFASSVSLIAVGLYNITLYCQGVRCI